jgi:DNA invertase Pin-like site-specific DNA recombinase
MKQEDSNIQYVIYARKSSEDEDRQVLSLDSQEKTLKDLSSSYGLKVAHIFREAHSAKAPDKRSIFAEMIDMVKSGKAQGIVCWKLDRLARNAGNQALRLEAARALHALPHFHEPLLPWLVRVPQAFRQLVQRQA